MLCVTSTQVLSYTRSWTRSWTHQLIVVALLHTNIVHRAREPRAVRVHIHYE